MQRAEELVQYFFNQIGRNQNFLHIEKLGAYWFDRRVSREVGYWSPGRGGGGVRVFQRKWMQLAYSVGR